MTLAPRERQALAQIENSLRSTDPRLAATMTVFTMLTTRRKIPRWKCLSPWRLRIRRLITMTAALAAVGLLILTVAVFSHPRPRSAPRGACGAAVVQVTCSRSGNQSPHTNRPAGGVASARAAAGPVFGK